MPSSVTIGNFDGVHIGHQRIFRRVVEIARANDWTPVVLTFDPHPAKIVAPLRAPLLLSSLEDRRRWMTAEGIEQVCVLPFNNEFAKLTPEQFVESILVGKLDARAVLVGDNFRFGNRQAGDTALMQHLGEKHGFTVEIVDAVNYRHHPVSSTEVRKLIIEGNVGLAARLLTRPYSLEGDVVPGRGVGSKQTVPTLNLATEGEVIPANGVYVTRTRELESRRTWQSVTNIGYRPTFDDGRQLSIETFLLEPLEGETPKRIRVELLHRLREERKFESPEALKRQILHDVERAKHFFRLLAQTETGDSPHVHL
jgi:riboflavin kinase/FMN adenylyltransferase